MHRILPDEENWLLLLGSATITIVLLCPGLTKVASVLEAWKEESEVYLRGQMSEESITKRSGWFH